MRRTESSMKAFEEEKIIEETIIEKVYRWNFIDENLSTCTKNNFELKLTGPAPPPINYGTPFKHMNM